MNKLIMPTEANIDDAHRLDAALSRFSGEWDGDATGTEIVEEWRQNVETHRNVDVW